MGTVTSSGACLTKAGSGVSVYFKGIIADTNIEPLITSATATASAITRKDWSGAWADLNTTDREIVGDVVSSLTAINMVGYDMNSNYSSRIEAENVVNIQRDNALRGLSILRDKKVEDFIDES